MTEVSEDALKAALIYISEDIARGSIKWNVSPYSTGRIVLTLTSDVRPTTWLAMHTDRAGWEAIVQAGYIELAKADKL